MVEWIVTIVVVTCVLWLCWWIVEMFTPFSFRDLWPFRNGIVTMESPEPLARSGRPSPIMLTAEQATIVSLAVRRARELTGNALLDDADVLVLIAQEYLHDADALARLAAAQRQRTPAPRRRIALED